MNEVTRIHLGRQPFTIAVDAHTALRAYLAEIKKEVGSKSNDVSEEIELRMAELLGERGISGDKVILMDDVAFLKEQLGEPKDFKDDDDSGDEPSAAEDKPTRRLFRDTENGMLAGVAAGLASYFGVDVLLIRILFVIAVFTGGWGILLYIALWLLVPEARSSSERLQMQGKAVTVGSLKEIVERADVHGVANRAGSTVGPFINSAFRVILKIAGIIVIITALATIFAMIAIGAYMASHDGQLFQENFFPVGYEEHVLVILILAWVSLASLFAILIGMAMVWRKWPIAPWATGVILGLLFVGLAVGTALVANTTTEVQQRFEAAHHSITRKVQPFNTVDVKGIASVAVEEGTTYSVTVSYVGKPNLGTIRTDVKDGKLEIDSTQFTRRSDCTLICLFPYYDMMITVTSPVQPTILQSDSPIDTRDNAEFVAPLPKPVRLND